VGAVGHALAAGPVQAGSGGGDVAVVVAHAQPAYAVGQGRVGGAVGLALAGVGADRDVPGADGEAGAAEGGDVVVAAGRQGALVRSEERRVGEVGGCPVQAAGEGGSLGVAVGQGQR